MRVPFPEGAGEESAVCAPYSAFKAACGMSRAIWVATRSPFVPIIVLGVGGFFIFNKTETFFIYAIIMS